MRYLITGGCGFIGSNFVRLILNKYKDSEVINLDKLTYAGNLGNLRDIEKNSRYKFIKGDICDKKLVLDLVKDVDIVVNFAAESHVDRSIIEPESFVKTDVLGTQNLLEACRKFNKRHLQISTDEVYGSIQNGNFKESDNLNPSSPYSASKASADLLVLSYHITYGLNVIITRTTNNFGPNQYPEKLIPLFVTNLLEGKKVPVYGNGMNIRDWVYVVDNCEAIDFVINNGKAGEIYNIGSDNEKNNLEITKFILKELGKDENSIEYVKDRLGHDKRYALDSTKINKLGWKPRFQFELALKETIKWYKSNEKWWKPIKSGEFLKFYQEVYSK